MSQVVIENPIINSPFDEPARHFRFSDEGITSEIVDGRRTSSYFVPIAKPKKKGKQQLQFETEWTQDRIEENKLVNDIRRRVVLWRKGGYVGVTPTTARLIAYWTDPNREKKREKAAKVSTARSLWVPAINNHGGFGRWAFIEISDPWNAKNLIRASLKKGAKP
jgi:hypothetical protein